MIWFCAYKLWKLTSNYHRKERSLPIMKAGQEARENAELLDYFA